MAELSMVEKARKRLEEVQSQVRRAQDRLEALQAEQHDLETFMRVVENYMEERPTEERPTEERPTEAAEPPPRSDRDPQDRVVGHHTQDMLKREPRTRQTEIATELIRHFRPGDIITARDVAQRLSDKFRHPENRIQKAHYLSSYLNKEAQCVNGILIRAMDLPRGHYRIKENPEQYLQG